MNLKEYARQITDGVTQRARNAAIKLLVNAGLSEEDARNFTLNLEKRLPSMKDGMRKYLQGVVRWALEGQFDPSEAPELVKINKLLFVMKNSPAYDFYDKDFNGESLESVKRSLNIELDEYEENLVQGSYSIEPIDSYEEALRYKKYAKDWCILESEEAYDEHTFNGICKFYFCLREGWKEERPIPGDNYPYDNYGYSMIAVAVDPEGDVFSITSRWNFDDAHDNFLTVPQLKALLGDKFNELKPA